MNQKIGLVCYFNENNTLYHIQFADTQNADNNENFEDQNTSQNDSAKDNSMIN